MNHFLEMELLKEKINIPKKTLNDFSYVFNEIFKQSEKRVAYKNIKLLYVKLRLFFFWISKGSLKVRDILFAYEFISGLKSSFPNVDLDACLSTIDSLFFMNVECKKINNITKDIHFIWLGEIKKENMEFMKIWKDFNPEFKVHLWTDKKSIPSPIFFIKSNLKHSLNHQLFFCI